MKTVSATDAKYGFGQRIDLAALKRPPSPSMR